MGEEAYQTFERTRLDDDPPSVKVHDKADRNLFSQIILVAESRSVNMKDVLAHTLGPLPWILANADESLRKTNKAALARELERNVSPPEAIQTQSTCIIDGMGLVQRMNGYNKLFAQLA